MFDLFGRNRDDNERDDGRPRIIFANLRRSSRPILTEAGYKVFSATAFSGWVLVVLVIWIFRIEVSLSKELVTSLAGSSVELSALSLAVLGILHELNKEDKWFKFGLLLVSILFVGVVFDGFFLALTWQPAFDLPQQITVVVIATLGLVAILQIDWKVALRFTRIRWIANFVLPTKVSTNLRRIRLAIPFVLPVLLVWLPDLNRVTAVVILFAGALIALVVLMMVTTLSLFKSKEETEPEDPFIATLRARYETEIKAIVRFGELKARTIDALKSLQTELVKTAFIHDQPPELVTKSSLVVRLRQMNIMEDERTLDTVLSTLVSESLIYWEGYNSFWTVPDEQEITYCLNCLNKLAIICSAKDTVFTIKADYIVNGYKLTYLREWLAIHGNLPISAVGEYIIPKVLQALHSTEKFALIRSGNQHIFVNRLWKISPDEWGNRMNDIQERFGTKYTRYGVLGIFLNSLPYSNDPDTFGKGGDPIRYDDEQIDSVISILSVANGAAG